MLSCFRYRSFVWVVTFVGALVTTGLNAASVTKKNTKKRTVELDEGTDSGFAKGQKVCFTDAKSKKLGCGSISAATATTSTVKLSSKILKKVKEGFSAALKDAPATAGKPAPNRTNVKGLYILAALQPTSYNKITFEPPAAESNNSAETLWKLVEKSGLAYVGGGLEAEFGVGTSMAIAVGGRYRANNPFLSESNYSYLSEEFYASTKISSTAVGGWLDFYYAQFGSGPFYFRLSSGLDFDSSTLTLTATKNNATDLSEVAEIASVTSKVNVVSLRLGMQFNLFFQPVGLSVSIQPQVPLAAIGKSSTATVTDDSTSALPTTTTGEDDVVASVAHGKGSVGVEIASGLYIAF